ncbi:hypothetical protein CCP4SC76_2160008 [Gammaproteobacteria bacterium]
MKSITILKSIFTVLTTGKELANAEFWKQVQVIMSLLTALTAMATAMGHPIPISHDELGNIALGISGIASAYLTYATSSRMGIDKNERTTDDGNANDSDPAGRMRITESEHLAKTDPEPVRPRVQHRTDLPELP